MAKKTPVTHRHPVANAMLQERKSPQGVPPKKGGKAKRNRGKDNLNAMRDAKLYQDS